MRNTFQFVCNNNQLLVFFSYINVEIFMLLSDCLCFSVPFIVAFQSYIMKDWLVSCQCKVNALLCLLIFFKLIYVCTLWYYKSGQ